MKRLLKMNKQELAAEYFIEMGIPADQYDYNTILAALYYGKRIGSMTEEEINSINEVI